MAQETLQKLGFSEKEITIYLGILANGRITASQLAKITKINRTTVYAVADELIGRGVITEDNSTPVAHLMALPPRDLKNIIQKDKLELDAKKQLVEQAIKELKPVVAQTKYSIPKMVFIGEGDLRGELLAELESFSLGKQVELTGLIPRNRVYEYLTGADLFISISQGEGLPVAVLEAMACRCLVILSDIPPHREIADGTDFIPLIHPNDVAGLAQEIKRIRHMSPTDRAEIGEKNRRLVEDRFSLTTMHKRYEEVYAQMLG